MLGIYACSYAPVLKQDKELDFFKNKILETVKEHCTFNEYYSKVPLTIGFSHSAQQGYSIAITRTNFNLLFRPYNFTIAVDPNTWDTFRYEDKLQLIAHEMMHAIFQQEHYEGDKYKYHFMYPVQNYITEEAFNLQFDAYLKDKCGE